jgi:orotidine-5'-phosphate decarboxylase
MVVTRRASKRDGMTVTLRPKLIVALDVDDLAVATSLVERLAPLGVWFKVGYEPLYGFGDAILARLADHGANAFVDAKMHDIPRTVEAGMRALVRPGVRIVTVHALGGNEMLQAAVLGASDRAAELGVESPEVFAITLLTSIAPEDLGELGLAGGPQENVFRLAALARDARCAGVVCSPHEARDLKAFFGADFKVICPGIRPSGSDAGDQKRMATPRGAVEAGADFLVVGRPIVRAADPVDAARAIIAEMDDATAPAHGARPA